MSELIPCPFCGGKNVLSTELQDGLPFIAYCQCGAENEAENWNTRPIEDALRKRIAELEGKIDQLTAHSDIERQDDKSSNDTQTQTIVYGKEDSEVQDV